MSVVFAMTITNYSTVHVDDYAYRKLYFTIIDILMLKESIVKMQQKTCA